jgi:Bacteriocin-protection, YdeI or OmpD-Associated/Domain of unknown function (DUF1905)
MVIVRISATIAVRGVNPYVLVSAQQSRRLRPDWRRPLPVILRIARLPRYRWCTNLMPAGDGNFYLYLHEHIRRVAAAGIGDRIGVELQFNAAYKGGPAHPMPKWFRDALREAPMALQNWRRLIPSRKKEMLRYFASLKSAAAQARNLERAMRVLCGQRHRFMARQWEHGR